MADKVGTVIVIIARQGEGKTTYAKKLAQKFKNKIVLDINYEYNENEFTTFHRFDTFQEYILNHAYNSIVIFEEATAFIGSFKDMDLTSLVIGVRHRGNVLCFLFHSIADVPPYLSRLAQYHYLMATNDDPADVWVSRKFYYKYLKHVPILIDKNNL